MSNEDCCPQRFTMLRKSYFSTKFAPLLAMTMFTMIYNTMSSSVSTCAKMCIFQKKFCESKTKVNEMSDIFTCLLKEWKCKDKACGNSISPLTSP